MSHMLKEWRLKTERRVCAEWVERGERGGLIWRLGERWHCCIQLCVKDLKGVYGRLPSRAGQGRGWALAPSRGFEDRQISNTALAASLAWNFHFCHRPAGTQPTPPKNTTPHPLTPPQSKYLTDLLYPSPHHHPTLLPPRSCCKTICITELQPVSV